MPDKESIIAAMDQAWRDHHHARDQTWRALQIEFLIVAAVVGVNWQIESPFAAAVSGFLILLTALCGIQITLRHRNRVEITKFRHIRHCGEALGLNMPDLIDDVMNYLVLNSFNLVYSTRRPKVFSVKILPLVAMIIFFMSSLRTPKPRPPIQAMTSYFG